MMAYSSNQGKKLFLTAWTAPWLFPIRRYYIIMFSAENGPSSITLVKHSKYLAILGLLKACALAMDVFSGVLRDTFGFLFKNPLTHFQPANSDFLQNLCGIFIVSAIWKARRLTFFIVRPKKRVSN